MTDAASDALWSAVADVQRTLSPSDALAPEPETPDADGFTIAELPPETDDVAVSRLAALSALEYDRVRSAEAKEMKVRTPVLDKLVEAARRESAGAASLQGRALRLEAPEPWPEPVDGAALLDSLAGFFSEHASLPAHGATVLALWSLHTHCYEAARHTPRLAITSAEKGSGKTTILDLLEMTCCRPLSASSLTAAALFRTVEAAKPTLLIDEADLFLAESPDIRALLNSGNKSNGQVIRCVGDDAEPRAFTVHAPAAVAAIGRLPDTLADRSIRLVMRRATTAERPARITAKTERFGHALARRCSRWVADHAADLPDDPEMPPGLANRAADNWRGLFALAVRAGGGWPERVTAAALASLEAGEAAESLGVALLRDVQAVFAETGATRLATAEIVRRLLEMDDRPWPEMPGSGKPITPSRLTRRLKDFGASRVQWRVPGSADRVWGFTMDGFADAFARYVPTHAKAGGAQSGDVVTLQTGSADFRKSEVVTELVTPGLSPLSGVGVTTCVTTPVTTFFCEKPNEINDVTMSPEISGGGRGERSRDPGPDVATAPGGWA